MNTRHRIHTPDGTIEFADQGQGPPVLISHGAAGGYDQGLLIGQLLPGFRFIAPSRFGYLGSELPAHAGPAEQADAFAAVLDALDLPQALVIGVSAGGPAALHFGYRHGERCAGLALIASVARPYPEPPRLRRLLGFLTALGRCYTPIERAVVGMRLRVNGVPRHEQATLRRDDPHAFALLRELLRLQPVAQRRAGIVNDMEQLARLTLPRLEQINVPALVIHDADDPVVPSHHGEWLASRLPHAGLCLTHGGGHLAVVTRPQPTIPLLRDFLLRQAQPVHA